MGNAAYNRGSKVIRDQIDRELAARPRKHPAEIALHHAERINGNLRDRVADLESELEKAKRYVRMARLERDMLKDELADARLHHDRLKLAFAGLRESYARVRRSWMKASRLLRMMPADMVRAARESGEHRDDAS